VFIRGTKTPRSRREVPLTGAALAALDDVPSNRHRYVFTTSRKCPGRDESGPFAFGCGSRYRVSRDAKPARIYDLRSTFISNALASGLTVFELRVWRARASR
jgi:integrase